MALWSSGMWIMASPRRVVPESSVFVGEVGEVGDVGGSWGPFSDTNVSPVMVREGAMVRRMVLVFATGARQNNSSERQRQKFWSAKIKTQMMALRD